jgi:uroporphyrinogen-III decarboxylase
MTSRERLLCVLKGELPDEVPVSPFVQEEYLSWYFNKKDTDRLVDAVTLAEELDFDLITRQYLCASPYFMRLCATDWEVAVKNEIRQGNYYRVTRIETPGGELTQIEAAPYNEKILSGIHFSTLDYLIKSAEDFAIFKKYLPPMPDSEKKMIRDAGVFARKTIGSRGVTCPWAIGGVYNLASTYISVQEMMTDCLADEEYYREYMDLFTALTVESHGIFADSEFDCVGIQGNIANGSMLGEKLFNEFVLPYEKKALRVLEEAGKPAIYHNCGKARNLYPCYKTLGISVWETVSPPPQGDNDLREAKDFFGGDLILSGNLDQVHFLKTASIAEIEEEAGRIMETGKPGGHYIFAASDYLETGTPVENVKAMIRGARRRGKYVV